MFNKKFKLIGTAIGLVAVLVALMVMPGVTQIIDPPPLSRKAIVQAVSQVVQATLVASPEEFFNLEKAAFLSHPKATFSIISAHSASRAWELLQAMAEGEKVGPITFGLLYTPDGLGPIYQSVPPGVILPSGLYKLQALFPVPGPGPDCFFKPGICDGWMAISSQQDDTLALMPMRLYADPVAKKLWAVEFVLLNEVRIYINKDNTIVIVVRD